MSAAPGGASPPRRLSCGRERALAREGRRTELDVERAALEEARARQKLYAAESDRDLDRHELASLVGLPAGTPLAVADDPELAVPEPEPGDAVAQALASRPPAARARRTGRRARAVGEADGAALQTVGQAEARYAYVPDAFGYDKYYLNFQENVASIGVSVVLPVLTGGRDSAQAAQSRARLEQVEAERRLRENDLTQQVGQAQARLARTRLEVGVARRAVALAGGSLSEAQSIAREGRGEVDAVDRAQLSLSEAEDELAIAAPGPGGCPAAAAGDPGDRPCGAGRRGSGGCGTLDGPRRAVTRENPPPGSRIIVNIAWSAVLL